METVFINKDSDQQATLKIQDSMDMVQLQIPSLIMGFTIVAVWSTEKRKYAAIFTRDNFIKVRSKDMVKKCGLITQVDILEVNISSTKVSISRTCFMVKVQCGNGMEQ